jgi:deazaflavin-dependent oxidoreductase (nitroreductase family)
MIAPTSMPEASLPYGPLMTRALPQIQRAFRFVNRYVAIPLIEAGLGPLCNTPLTGSLMVLRTRGRTSGLWREAPLGYLVLDGNVYCCAGFGRRTQWLRNIEADPHVEVQLPTLAVTGIAEEVTDPAEWSRGMRALLASLGLISRAVIGDVRRVSDERLEAMAGGLPLVRIRITGLGVGPFDPGGRGWVLPTVLGAAWLLNRLRRRLPRSPGD